MHPDKIKQNVLNVHYTNIVKIYYEKYYEKYQYYVKFVTVHKNVEKKYFKRMDIFLYFLFKLKHTTKYNVNKKNLS